MYRMIEDFITDWEKNCRCTLAVFESITEEKKGFEIVEGHNSLEWLSWHLTTATAYFMGQVGLSLDVELNPKATPATLEEIISTYKLASAEVISKVKGNFTDESLSTNVDSHGRPTPIGALLRAMVDHQTHHRAQMQVLLRQAGLNVPSVMGPTKEASKF